MIRKKTMIIIGVIVFLLTYSPLFIFIHDTYAAPDAQIVKTVSPVVVPDAQIVKIVSPVIVPDVSVSTPSNTTQSWWQALLLPIFSALGLVIASFFTVGLRKLVSLIEAKFKIDIPDSIELIMTDKAKWALAWVEEKAENRLLHGDGKKTPGAEKLNTVINLLQKFADDLGYGSAWQKDKIEALAEGVLHLNRIDSEGSIGSGGERATQLELKKNGNA